MDKIEKALKRLTDRERRWVKEILKQLFAGDYKGLNITKLKGREDIFRARKGNIRIIYRLKNGDIFILLIERRSEKTYKSLKTKTA
ncbi:MAG: hypothetical protein WD889_01580 [Candidatus Colwellbacteria bacterium]